MEGDRKGAACDGDHGSEQQTTRTAQERWLVRNPQRQQVS